MNNQMEVVRITDAMDNEKNLIDKHPQHHDLIDRESRNVSSQGLTAESLKFTLGFNMHG